jgi:CheY-like chemotaxis protein
MASKNNRSDVRASNTSHGIGGTVMNRTLRTAVAVISEADRSPAVGALLDATDYDVVFVESPAHAYSQIRRVSPDVVLVCLECDDPTAFQVLSMLKADSSTSSIPVIACMTASRRRELETDVTELERATPSRSPALPLLN